MAKNTMAERIAMEQQHRYFALVTFLDSEGTVRCVDNLLPSQDVHILFLHETPPAIRRRDGLFGMACRCIRIPSNGHEWPELRR
jgi:hypothetical protein